MWKFSKAIYYNPKRDRHWQTPWQSIPTFWKCHVKFSITVVGKTTRAGIRDHCSSEKSIYNILSSSQPCNTLVVNPQTYDPSCDLCSLALWTYYILYDCGIFILFMMNLIKHLLLMFDNMTLYFGVTINVNVITTISVIFECC